MSIVDVSSPPAKKRGRPPGSNARPAGERPPARADFAFDRLYAARIDGPLCGVDEAGRGPWAGPVVAAAVVLDPNNVPAGLADSKQLKAETRETLFAEILATADVAVAVASPRRIDYLNIRGATLWAMTQAVRGLSERPKLALIDGVDVPHGLPCAGEAIVEGDAHSAAIAAASIVAKVTRDRMMVMLGSDNPGYGFENHKGYGTPEHRLALQTLGVTVHHRRSFAPIRELVVLL